jgi:hypothetical protein
MDATMVTLIRCVGCGLPLGRDVPNAGALAHVRSCAGHPLARELAATGARERAAIEEGQRLAAEVANLRDEVASWRKGVEDANRIGQRERADADTLRRVAETVSKRAHELAAKLASAQRWIISAAAERERRAKPFPVVFDHACVECIPHGELVKPGFRCAVHEARAAAPATTTTKEQSHG